MQAIALSKQLFRGNEIRIFGTSERPLFVAKDVAKVLDIKSVKTSIANFEKYERDVVHTMDLIGRMQETTVLTEAGLYALVLKSRKPVAREFKQWVLAEVLPTIRKTGVFSMTENLSQQVLEAQVQAQLQSQSQAQGQSRSLSHSQGQSRSQTDLEELQIENTILRETYKPLVEYHDLDINDFTDSPCVYLIHVTDNDYKFGVSGEIDTRYDTHIATFTKEGYAPKLVKIWKCETMQIMKNTEMKIKRFASLNNILTPKYNRKEIITTDDIAHVITRIDEYVNKQNSVNTLSIEICKLELITKGKQADAEGKRADAEGKRADADGKQSDVEIQRLKIEGERWKLEGERLRFEIMKFQESTRHSQPAMLMAPPIGTNASINNLLADGLINHAILSHLPEQVPTIAPLAIAPLAIAPLAIAPLAIAPLAIAPLAIAPLAIAPLAIAPLAIAPPVQAISPPALVFLSAPYSANIPVPILWLIQVTEGRIANIICSGSVYAIKATYTSFVEWAKANNHVHNYTERAFSHIISKITKSKIIYKDKI